MKRRKKPATGRTAKARTAGASPRKTARPRFKPSVTLRVSKGKGSKVVASLTMNRRQDGRTIQHLVDLRQLASLAAAKRWAQEEAEKLGFDRYDFDASERSNAS